MAYYNGPYRERLNRFGYTHQSRIQGAREKEFELYLEKSVYRINFDYNGETHPSILEPFKQDETQTKGYLLTRVNLDIPNGTILQLPDKNKLKQPWMIWWLENMKASGYNRYVVLKMTHEIQWVARDGNKYSQLAYFYGPGMTRIADLIKSSSLGASGHTVYSENNNLFMFITYTNSHIEKDDYFEVVINNDIIQPYRIANFDVISTPGVEYVSVDPFYIKDQSPIPEKKPTDSDEDFYWLSQGGSNNGST